MCAIAGIAGVTDPRRTQETVRRMLACLGHRGPDGEGVFSGEGITLGHRRLAILDLSEAGAQPMTSRDGRWTLALNGEIFNYREIAAGLDGPFRSATDTEVLLEAIAAWGVEKTLDRLIGMFAFALWDRRERELILVRDRFGEKPLVYWERAGAIAFASELKALAPLSERRMDPGAVDAYLGLGYVPAPWSIFRDCRKLAAGHVLRFRDGRIRVERWWGAEQNRGGRSGTCPTAEVRRLLTDVVGLRLRADVPVALALSGGVDSSVIAAECVGLGARPAAFSVSFDGDETDAGFARAVAARLGLSLETIRVSADEIPDLFRHYDEPFADSSAIAAMALARALAGRFKVVLNGDGGDEAFGGYRHYERIAAKQAVKRAAARLGWCDGQGPAAVYVQSKALFRVSERSALLNGNWSGNALDQIAGPQVPRDAGAFERALGSDREVYLPNDLAYKSDIALGSAGMEGRAPFLDHRLLEWTGTLPSGALVRGSQKKILLRAAYRGVLPDAVLDRPKHGFGAPIEKWLQAKPMEKTPCPWLDPSGQTGERGQRLWTLLALAGWAREWKATW
ncbi:MAG TPA: asparagine synthase (glutamine-hydrolyzing) [Rhizomicrobium sp.]|nr:asparagine synthase (glutamine-hydrolyzing) [Rhizomicrobium sp.]